MNTKITFFLRYVLLLLTCIAGGTGLRAQDKEIEISREEAMKIWLDTLEKIDRTIPYKTGKVDLNEQIDLNIPQGYKFVPQQEARMIVSDLWGNPQDDGVLGMIVPAGYKLSNLDGWAFVVTYEESGYVKDEDAEDIDYAALLKDIQEDEAAVNEERAKLGYESMHLIDWAARPYYDKERKILHWAKKLQFGDAGLAPEELTLNYDVRILGRKGILSLNAVGTMDQLDLINQHIPDVLGIAGFKEGYAYSDFNPSVDKVAAYTVGGLVAGKLLAKSGILVLLLKNIKLVIFAIVGVFALFRKRIAGFFRRRSEEPDYAAVPAVPGEFPQEDGQAGSEYAAFNDRTADGHTDTLPDEEVKS